MRVSRGACVALVTAATFLDIIAYSIGVPVLPDLSRRLGASATTIGLLFASFGVTLLIVSIPMGAVSDRIGRKGPMVIGLAALLVATVVFAFADRLPWLFAARLTQGAADAVAWVVGFALLADLYGPDERGRMTGIVMSGSSIAYMIGPTIGGWLYDIGGMRVPFLATAAATAVVLLAWMVAELPAGRASHEPASVRDVLTAPGMAACVGAVAMIGATLAMLEPVGSLHLGALGVTPARIGIVFGVASLCNSVLHPLYGRLGDRFGARRLTILGLIAGGLAMPLFGLTWSFGSAIPLFVLQAGALALAIAPSLTYMSQTAARGGAAAHGVAYGLYNVAWAVGLLVGPAIGGFAYERIGFRLLTLAWAPVMIAITVVIASSRGKAVASNAL